MLRYDSFIFYHPGRSFFKKFIILHNSVLRAQAGLKARQKARAWRAQASELRGPSPRPWVGPHQARASQGLEALGLCGLGPARASSHSHLYTTSLPFYEISSVNVRKANKERNSLKGVNHATNWPCIRNYQGHAEEMKYTTQIEWRRIKGNGTGHCVLVREG